MSDAGHFVDWTLGERKHTHLGKCIKCGSPEGDVVLYARMTLAAGRAALWCDRIGSRLCPWCNAKYLPLTPAMDQELKRLGAKLSRDVRKRGCPCCQAGLEWYPAEQVH